MIEMKQKIIPVLFLLAFTEIVIAQQTVIDRMMTQVNATSNDTIRLSIYNSITEEYTESNPDSSLLYAEKVLSLAKKLKLKCMP
jgi:hypothetical protein